MSSIGCFGRIFKSKKIKASPETNPVKPARASISLNESTVDDRKSVLRDQILKEIRAQLADKKKMTELIEKRKVEQNQTRPEALRGGDNKPDKKPVIERRGKSHSKKNSSTKKSKIKTNQTKPSSLRKAQSLQIVKKTGDEDAKQIKSNPNIQPVQSGSLADIDSPRQPHRNKKRKKHKNEKDRNEKRNAKTAAKMTRDDTIIRRVNSLNDIELKRLRENLVKVAQERLQKKQHHQVNRKLKLVANWLTENDQHFAGDGQVAVTESQVKNLI